jgi:hypothetical protein
MRQGLGLGGRGLVAMLVLLALVVRVAFVWERILESFL